MKKTFIKPVMVVVEIKIHQRLLAGSAIMDKETGRFSITDAEDGEENDIGW